MASLSRAAVEGALPDFCEVGIGDARAWFIVRRLGLALEFVEDVVIETPFEAINQDGRIAAEDALAVEGVANADVMLDVQRRRSPAGKWESQTWSLPLRTSAASAWTRSSYSGRR